MQEPTIIFTTTDFGMNLQTALYGEVTPERLEKEKAIAKHRCEQLAPQPKRQERPRRQRREARVEDADYDFQF